MAPHPNRSETLSFCTFWSPAGTFSSHPSLPLTRLSTWTNVGTGKGHKILSSNEIFAGYPYPLGYVSAWQEIDTKLMIVE